MKGRLGVWVRVALGVAALGCWGGVKAQDTLPRAQEQATAPVLTEKQKKLLEDSEKLVQMAAELKVSVGKSTKNELSLDVVRKAEAVEKLARSVKERIREAR